MGRLLCTCSVLVGGCFVLAKSKNFRSNPLKNGVASLLAIPTFMETISAV